MSEMKSHAPDAWDLDIVLAAFRELACQHGSTADPLEPGAAPAAAGALPAAGER
jgi:hypothetical protein